MNWGSIIMFAMAFLMLMLVSTSDSKRDAARWDKDNIILVAGIVALCAVASVLYAAQKGWT